MRKATIAMTILLSVFVFVKVCLLGVEVKLLATYITKLIAEFSQLNITFAALKAGLVDERLDGGMRLG